MRKLPSEHREIETREREKEWMKSVASCNTTRKIDETLAITPLLLPPPPPSIR